MMSILTERDERERGADDHADRGTHYSPHPGRGADHSAHPGGGSH